MYNNPYMQNFNQQNINERIDNQIAQLQQMKEQIKNTQPTNLTQNFQISPINRETIKYASSIDEIQKENVIGDTPYFSRDMSILWIKNNKGEVKTYELNEIIPRDEKDIKIDFLMAQIEELKKGMNKSESKSNLDEPITNTDESTEPTNVSNVSKLSKKSK